MLIKCPECGLQLSDKAILCPHCGYVMKEDSLNIIIAKNKSRKKRLPNGFGQITKLKDKKLKKPYRAMVTVGKNEDGRPICKLLKPTAYFATYNEAYEALLNNAKNPYDVSKDATIDELFNLWLNERQKEVSSGRYETIKSAWKYTSEISNVKISDIRQRHIKRFLADNDVEIPNSVKKTLIAVFRGIFDYAIENEIVERNYAKEIQYGKFTHNDIAKGHKSVKDSDLDILLSNLDNAYVRAAIIQCYTGWRPSELLKLTLDDVNLEEGYMIGGMKTENGKNRKIPIHPKIKDLVKQQYDIAIENNLNSFMNVKSRGKIKQMVYRSYWNNIIKLSTRLNLSAVYIPHDFRKTFVTKAKKYKVDEYAIKYIVGHAITDLTERVYTERDMEWLKTEMLKIK